MTVAPDGVTPAEQLSLDPELTPRLLALAPGESTRLTAWPLEPGRRGDVLLTRRDVYAPGAEILVLDGNASRKAARSKLAFFFGEAVGDEATRVLLSIDPVTVRLSSFARTSEGWTELRPLDERSTRRVPPGTVRPGPDSPASLSLPIPRTRLRPPAIHDARDRGAHSAAPDDPRGRHRQRIHGPQVRGRQR